MYYPERQKLYCVAFSFLRNAQMAEDMVQETFLKLWKNSDKLNDVREPEAFAITTLRNLCLNKLRKTNQERSIDVNENDFGIPDSNSLADSFETKDETLYLKGLIAQLPELQRQIIMLRHYADCSYEEIEAATGLNVKHIRVIISRTRKSLKEQFNKRPS